MSFDVSIFSVAGTPAVQRDTEYRYSLLAPARFEAHILVPRGFANAWISILPNKERGTSTITVGKGYAWDGCTGVPDGPRNENGIPHSWIASVFHDAMYQFADSIAHAFGWSVRDVLRFADDGFRSLLQKTWPAAAELYYHGVSIFGYAYNRAARALRRIASAFSRLRGGGR